MSSPPPSILLRGILGGGNGILLLIVLFLGLPLSVSEKLFRFHEAGMLFSLVGKLFLGGILAFGLGFSEFLLVSRTSSLTLSIAGIFKVSHGSCANTRRRVLSHPYWALCGGSFLRSLGIAACYFCSPCTGAWCFALQSLQWSLLVPDSKGPETSGCSIKNTINDQSLLEFRID